MLTIMLFKNNWENNQFMEWNEYYLFLLTNHDFRI